MGDGDGKVTTSPPTVIALPGNRVCDPTKNPLFLSAVMVELPITISPGGVVDTGAGLTLKPPSGSATMTCPPTVIVDPGSKVVGGFPKIGFPAES